MARKLARKRDRIPEVLFIEDLATLRALADPTRLQMLELLVRPLSVTELAEEMAVPRTRLYHHVKTLEDNSLIRVVNTRRAGALSERVYEVAALAFRPGPRLLAETRGDELAEGLLTVVLDTTRADFTRAFRSGLIRLDEVGGNQLLAVGRCVVQFPAKKAERFAKELENLVQRLTDEDTDEEGDPVFALAFVFYPTTRRTP